MKKLTLMIAVFVLAGLSALYAQTTVITGTVTSSVEGEGTIPGVAVTVFGTTIGTQTDMDGKYTLEVPANATRLVFQFIGMKSVEEDINGRTRINVVMEPDLLGIDEVVVTAIGIERKTREIGYSMTKIDDEKLTQAKSTTISAGLVGKVAGLQINQVSGGVNPQQRVVLRGNRSFLGNNEALVVLDGVPVSATYLTQLNPNDVEDISILKGANASALYGSDASNGVIMVTTRQGSRDKIQVQFSNTTTFDKAAYIPELQTRFGAGSSSDAFGNPVYETYENQQYGPEFDGEMRDIGMGNEYNDEYERYPFKAIPDEKLNFFDIGLTMQNDLSFSAGNENSSYFISAQDATVKGLVPKDELRRNSIRFNGTRQYGGFKASVNVNYTHTEDNITTSNVLWSVYNTPQNVPLTSYSDWRTPSTPEKINYADINHYYNAYYDNPYTELDKNRQDRRRDYMIGTLSLSQDITPWLNATVRSSVSFNYTVYKQRFEEWDYSTWALEESGRAITGDVPADVADGTSMGYRWTNDLLIKATKNFGDISLTAIAGATTRSTYSHSLSVGVTSLEVPGLYNIKNRNGELSGSQSYSETRKLGVFGDITIGYRNFLFLHASGRNDWDSRLNPEYWSFFYPGIDASFVFTEAIPFLKDNPILSYGKLRGGIAKVGSVSINAYELENEFNVLSGYPFGQSVAHGISGSMKNPFMEPEFTLSNEIGIDLNFFNSRINLEAAYYSMSTTNQTLPADIAPSSGFTSMYINSGEMYNSGLELELGLVPVFNTDIRWDFNVNYSYWYNEVVSLTPAFDELLINSNNYVYAIVGETYPTLKWSDFDRDPQGRVIVDAVTGLPTKSTDLFIGGQTTPKHILGLQNYVRYKGFTFGLSAEYRGGHIMRSGPARDMAFTGISAITAWAGREKFVYPNSVINTGTAENPVYVPNTNIQTNDGNVDFWTQTYRNVSQVFAHNAAFWKLREVSLFYDVPQNLLTYTGGFVKGARVGFIGRNLLMLLPESNMYGDPESNRSTGNDVGYAPGGAIPPTKSYGFNITFTF
jgi:TonB-linked SusC/RagA family outer membrane protein